VVRILLRIKEVTDLERGPEIGHLGGYISTQILRWWLKIVHSQSQIYPNLIHNHLTFRRYIIYALKYR
jgi:hypothetical protein